MRRALAIAVAGALLAGIVATAVSARPTNRATLPAGLGAPADAQSTAFYCAGFTGALGAAPATVAVANTTNATRLVVVTIRSTHGAVDHRKLTVPAEGTTVLPLSAFPGVRYYGVRAAVAGGGVAGFVVGAGANHAVAPCADQPRALWSLAGLTTVANSTTVVTVLNPGPTIAVVNLSAVSVGGFSAPAPFQGVVVPAYGVTAISMGAQIVGEKDLAVRLRAVRGQVVAAATVAWSVPAPWAESVAMAPGPSQRWWFPDLATNQAATSTIALANFTNQLVTATLFLTTGSSALTPTTGAVPPRAISPFAATLPARTVTDVTVSPSSRVPAGGPATVEVVGTAPLAATLLSSVRGSEPWLAPPAALGPTQLLDAPVAVARAPGLGSLLVVNPSGHAVTVTVGPRSVVLAARSVVALPAPTARRPEIHATGPVAVAGALNGAPNGVRVVDGSGGG